MPVGARVLNRRFVQQQKKLIVPVFIARLAHAVVRTMATSNSTATTTTDPGPGDAYALALERLAQLQSNRAVTSLFDRPPSDPSVDPNALAVPEMLAWLRRAGYTPQSLAASGLRCVHVAGTKGKGSVSAFVASILQQSLAQPGGGDGRRRRRRVVGLYTSPHVVSVRERLVIDGAPLPPAVFARDAELAGPATKPFYFRFLTLVAAHAFAAEGVTDAVVECGIGGEHDATAALLADPALVTAAVVTQLGVDHVAMLGDAVDKIAWHKAGVFKPGRKGFTVRPPTEAAAEVLRARAREKGAEALVVLGDDEVEAWEGVDGARLRGPFQKKNMALAAAAAREHLLRTGAALDGRFGTDGWALADMPEAFRRGLREASLRARGEVVADDDAGIEWHVDGAHTDDSLAGVGRWFRDRTGAGDGDGAVTVLLFNQQDRNPGPLLRALLASPGAPSFDHAVFARNEEASAAGGDLSVQRALADAMKAIRPEAQTAVYDAVRPAVEHVRRIAARAKQDRRPCKVLVTGSFHLAGPVLKAIGQEEP
ncbi:hypothetical protein VTJ83DRAFT_174 [Remersonia thermophila]|uniref:tetrahydrofolate synthase n=1 Tax=Remersonia thermophila TaxID=72144 RepID=A0ABR4DKB5_9PEZI